MVRALAGARCQHRRPEDRSLKESDSPVGGILTGDHSFPFLRAWLAGPRTVGAIAPSGPALARLITADITQDSLPVLELGAGTGVFTRELLARGLPEGDLTLVESGGRFARRLRREFPEARVLEVDAAALDVSHRPPGGAYGAVVSGLPMRTMNHRTRTAVLEGILRVLRPGGSLVQFTYGLRCPVPGGILDALGLRATRIGWTVANLPPAAVYRIGRRADGV